MNILHLCGDETMLEVEFLGFFHRVVWVDLTFYNIFYSSRLPCKEDNFHD